MYPVRFLSILRRASLLAMISSPRRKQSLTNVKNILAEAGCSLDDVVKTTVLLADIKDFGPMNEIYGEFFKGVFVRLVPASR